MYVIAPDALIILIQKAFVLGSNSGVAGAAMAVAHGA